MPRSPILCLIFICLMPITSLAAECDTLDQCTGPDAATFVEANLVFGKLTSGNDPYFSPLLGLLDSMTSVQTLIIHSNPGMTWIPSGFFNLTSLTYVQMQANCQLTLLPVGLFDNGLANGIYQEPEVTCVDSASTRGPAAWACVKVVLRPAQTIWQKYACPFGSTGNVTSTPDGVAPFYTENCVWPTCTSECHTNAKCYDGVCICDPGLVGDGTTSGTGCTVGTCNVPASSPNPLQFSLPANMACSSLLSNGVVCETSPTCTSGYTGAFAYSCDSDGADLTISGCNTCSAVSTCSPCSQCTNANLVFGKLTSGNDPYFSPLLGLLDSMTSVQTLIIHSNPGITWIPSGFFNLTSLKYVQMQANTQLTLLPVGLFDNGLANGIYLEPGVTCVDSASTRGPAAWACVKVVLRLCPAQTIWQKYACPFGSTGNVTSTPDGVAPFYTENCASTPSKSPSTSPSASPTTSPTITPTISPLDENSVNVPGVSLLVIAVLSVSALFC